MFVYSWLDPAYVAHQARVKLDAGLISQTDYTELAHGLPMVEAGLKRTKDEWQFKEEPGKVFSPFLSVTPKPLSYRYILVFQ